MPFRHLVTFLLGAFLLAGPLEAQLRGIVRDQIGTPLENVTVEVWGPSPVPTGTRTDRSGVFHVTGEQLRGAECLSFRRIGYQTRVVRPAEAAADSVLEITLEADPVPIEGITAQPWRDRGRTGARPRFRRADAASLEVLGR
jgi:hypothetical protein